MGIERWVGGFLLIIVGRQGFMGVGLFMGAWVLV